MKLVRNIVLIIFCLASSFEIKAQPYIYYSIQLSDTINGEFEKLVRYNLAANSVEDFLPEQAGKYVSNVWDPSQSYIAIDVHNYGHFLFDCSNTAINFDLNEIFGRDIDEMLYSSHRNKLYLFSDDYNKISVLDIPSGQITSELNLGIAYSSNFLMEPARNVFFSTDEGKIYFFNLDTLTHAEQIWTYSLETNSIIEKRNLVDLGYAGSDSHGVIFGKNGKGIIESGPVYTNPIKDFYYRLYDFDTDSAYPFIYHNGFAGACFTGNGEFLLIMEMDGDLSDSVSSYHTGLVRIYNTWSGQILKTLNFPPGGIVYTFDNYPNDIYYVKDIELPTRQIFTLKMDSIFNELNLRSLTPSTATVNSPSFTLVAKGRGFDSSSTVYFNGQTKTTTFVSDSLLTAQILSSDISVAGNFPVWVTDKWAVSDTLQFTVTQSSSLNLIVNLKSSQGALLTTGSLQYYEGSWKDAVNNGDGTFTVTTNLNTVSLRMAYEYGSQTVANINAHNNIYTFQTVNAAVQLKNSLGNLIDAGTVQYYSGAWRNFGTTTNGVANKELLPINYSFRMAYEFASLDKQQNISNDPTVVFQTVNASVQLKNSLGNLIDAGTVQYYSGAWRNFGATTNGVATKELLPINYSFRMVYEFASIDKQQNLLNNPTVVFQTVNAAVQLKNSSGNLIDAGTVQYYSGAWRNFGTTTNGVANKELLPINYSFRMAYEYVSNDKQQNLSTNPVVNFTTVLCSVKVSNTTNQPLSNANVKYYSGAWRDFGITNADGVTTKELLPANLSFRASVGNVSMDKQQDITANNLVEINLNTP